MDVQKFLKELEGCNNQGEILSTVDIYFGLIVGGWASCQSTDQKILNRDIHTIDLLQIKAAFLFEGSTMCERSGELDEATALCEASLEHYRKATALYSTLNLEDDSVLESRNILFDKIERRYKEELLMVSSEFDLDLELKEISDYFEFFIDSFESVLIDYNNGGY